METNLNSPGICHQVWQNLDLPTHTMNLSIESRSQAVEVLNQLLEIALVQLEAKRLPWNLTGMAFYRRLKKIIDLKVQLEQVQCWIHLMPVKWLLMKLSLPVVALF